MILKEVEVLTENIQMIGKSKILRTTINHNMSAHWDYLKGFLAIHYKFNKKYDTKFWKDCREYTDVSQVKFLLDLYDDLGPLSYTNSNIKSMIAQEMKDEIFGLVGFDTILLGQGVVPKNFDSSTFNADLWRMYMQSWEALSSFTIPIGKDLGFLVSRNKQ